MAGADVGSVRPIFETTSYRRSTRRENRFIDERSADPPTARLTRARFCSKVRPKRGILRPAVFAHPCTSSDQPYVRTAGRTRERN